MSSIKEKLQRKLDLLDGGRNLVQLIDGFIDEYPDPYLLAKQHAADILLKRIGKAVDPRYVWWHQFTTASSSPRSFTGWQHSRPPQKSVPFTELVAQRFDLPFQDATDELNVYGGFYKEGAQAHYFDETNEIPMLPSDVQKDFWALDFAEIYRAKVTRFWAERDVAFRVLAKINLLGECAKAVLARRITEAEAAALRGIVVPELEARELPSLTQLQANHSTVSLTTYAYELGHVEYACFFTFGSSGGRVTLYRPWAKEAIQGFDSELAMAAWLRQQLRDQQTMAEFLAAALVDPGEQPEVSNVRAVLQGIANSRSDQAALALLHFRRVSISDDFFVHIARRARNDMERSAAALLNNAGLRKAMLSGYLSAFLNVFAGFTPLGWPMSLALLGAALGRLGLGVDAAVHATSEEARKSALRQAMLDCLFAALNLTEIGFQSTFASLAYEAPFHETRASLARWQVAREPDPILAGRETNQLIEGELATDGRLRGVRVDEKGDCWIEMNGLTYRVRYSHELSTWLIVPLDNPFALGPLFPVRVNDGGDWHLLVPPEREAPPAVIGMINETSQFWDEYTATHVIQSQKFSAQARARQKKLLETQSIPILGINELPAEDEHGIYCVRFGNTFEYTYREADGQYANELIKYYTDEASSVNDILRQGIHKYTDSVDYINDLATTLERLPKNNEVNLYRGGHGGRGTSGEHFRSGRLNVGDILVNTDLTSWTENPFMVRHFAASRHLDANGWTSVFDDTSVVFELPAHRYNSGIPISAFSLYWDEAETLFLPGHYFKIDKLSHVHGERYRFIQVTLSQVVRPVARPVYDLRTGAPFDRAAFVERVKSPDLANRFFPDQ
ncbi:dermonecrotic toxin domain-containing protein [Pseudomonas taiwanensis]|uniref:Dermonecrotic toxin N-terminal domain-containing protein n=1 Tax=Pseudomonas taiwanensis TaxID=470150 RepID=A0ABR6V2H2_9PSED|nr:DUF6543 domain-containing protein [Pseudomonas taiwanensis]MBC3474097.1 hypothetical protein [Pseudomonas taiwanensis]